MEETEETESHAGPMSPEELEAYRKTTEAIRERGATLEDEKTRLKGDIETMQKQNLEMETQRREMEERTERMILLGAKTKYQQEIHGVAINVLVSILTKDALKSIKESEFSAAPKLDITQTVDFSLMVAKKYVDELHKITVSQKQLAEYKDQIFSSMQSGQPGSPFIVPSPAE